MANTAEPAGATAVVAVPPRGAAIGQPAVLAWLCGRCLQPALTGDAVLRCDVCAAVFDRGDGRPLPALEADDNGHDPDARDPDDGQLLVNDTPATEVWLCGTCLGELTEDRAGCRGGEGMLRCERTGCGAVFTAAGDPQVVETESDLSSVEVGPRSGSSDGCASPTAPTRSCTGGRA